MPQNRKKQKTEQRQKAYGSSRGHRERHLSVRGELRQTPDVAKIARVVVSLAVAQAEADAQAEVATNSTGAATNVETPTTGDDAVESGND